MLTYSYDALNRVILKVVPERAGLTAAQTRDPGSSPGQANDGYDLRNLQLYARFEGPGGPGIANQYDGFGRLVSTSADTDGTARTLAYQYDREGRRTRITHPDGNWFSSDRDGLGRLYYLAAPDNVGRYYSSYRADGLPGGQSRGNGASTWTSRDGVGRLNGLGHYYGQGGTGDVLWLYDFNPASQIRSVNRDNDAYAWTGHYAVNRAYATNGLNQYTAAGSATFGYDLNGNLTSDGGRTYVYDVENRLVSASTGVTLAYDPLGRLYQITAGNGAVTRLLYDGDALVAEYDSSGAMTRRYIHWDGADVPIMSYDGPTLASPRYLHPDHQGSIVALSTASGATQINRYDEYGIPAATNAGRFQYTGQIWLAEIGMYYYKARIYSPTLGRMMQTDPIGYADQFNLYAYVGDDPVNKGDPTGKQEANLYACAKIGTGCGARPGPGLAPGVTVGVGGTVSGHLGPLNGSGTRGTVVDSSGEVRRITDIGGAVQRTTGAGAQAGITVQVSNGHADDLAGPFKTVHGQVGPVSGTAFIGTNARGQTVAGISVTVGPGGGASGGVGMSNTTVTSLGPPSRTDYSNIACGETQAHC